MGGIRVSARAFVPTGFVPYVRQDGTDEFEGYVDESIYVVPAGGGTPIRLTDPNPNFDVMPEPSPDGTRVAFSRNGADIRIVDVATLDEVHVVNFDEGSNFGINSRHRWKPDGSRLVYCEQEQFPSRTTLYSISSSGVGSPTILKQWTPGGGMGDFGYAYDGSVVIFWDPVTATLWSVEDDGTNATDLGVSVPSQYGRVTPGHVSDLIVWVDQSTREIKKCALDGSGVTVIETIGTNGHRFSNHILSPDDETIFYTYDTEDQATADGWFTSSLGLDSQVMAVPVDGSGEVATGVWTYMETYAGNPGNNLCDTPHAMANGRFYIAYNETPGSTTSGGDINDYHFGSFLPDGSDGRIEDDFDISGPEPAPSWDAAVARITMEWPIAG